MPGLSLVSAEIIAFLALLHGFAGLFPVESTGPLADALQNGDHGAAFFAERIFGPGRNLVVGMPFHHAVFH